MGKQQKVSCERRAEVRCSYYATLHYTTKTTVTIDADFGPSNDHHCNMLMWTTKAIPKDTPREKERDRLEVSYLQEKEKEMHC